MSRNVSDSHPIPTSLCPACGYAMDRASAQEGDAKPSEGDFSICLGCGAALQFDAGLHHRLVTLSELSTLACENPDMLKELEAARQQVVQLRAAFPTGETSKGRA